MNPRAHKARRPQKFRPVPGASPLKRTAGKISAFEMHESFPTRWATTAVRGQTASIKAPARSKQSREQRRERARARANYLTVAQALDDAGPPAKSEATVTSADKPARTAYWPPRSNTKGKKIHRCPLLLKPAGPRPGEQAHATRAERGNYDGANDLPGSPITHRRPATASTTADECFKHQWQDGTIPEWAASPPNGGHATQKQPQPPPAKQNVSSRGGRPRKTSTPIVLRHPRVPKHTPVKQRTTTQTCDIRHHFHQSVTKSNFGRPNDQSAEACDVCQHFHHGVTKSNHGGPIGQCNFSTKSIT